MQAVIEAVDENEASNAAAQQRLRNEIESHKTPLVQKEHEVAEQWSRVSV